MAFARRYWTIRYDRRGYGKSSMPDRTFSDVSDLHRLLRYLGTERAYLMGTSNGGKVALEFALEHPRMVAALVLVGPNLGGYCPSEEKQRRVSEILSVARERGAEAGGEAWMKDPFYPPAKERSAVSENATDRTREPSPAALHAGLSRGTGPADRGEPLVNRRPNIDPRGRA